MGHLNKSGRAVLALMRAALMTGRPAGYKKDLYHYDVAHVLKEQLGNQKFLWVVRYNGTHIFPFSTIKENVCNVVGACNTLAEEHRIKVRHKVCRGRGRCLVDRSPLGDTTCFYDHESSEPHKFYLWTGQRLKRISVSSFERIVGPRRPWPGLPYKIETEG